MGLAHFFINLFKNRFLDENLPSMSKPQRESINQRGRKRVTLLLQAVCLTYVGVPKYCAKTNARHLARRVSSRMIWAPQTRSVAVTNKYRRLVPGSCSQRVLRCQQAPLSISERPCLGSPGTYLLRVRKNSFGFCPTSIRITWNNELTNAQMALRRNELILKLC